MPIDYNKGQIYKLWSLDNPNMVYVGSTCQPLYKRLSQHKKGWKGWKRTGAKYMRSCDMFENCQEVKIELIEESPCDNRQQLVKTEGKYIRGIDCINKKVAGRTGKEYYQDNRETLLQYQKEYRQTNRDKIKEYQQTNREAIAQYKKEWHKANKEKINKQKKEYYQANKEAIAQRDKEYYQDNRDKIKARKSIKMKCECGCEVRKDSIYKHRKSKKHERLMNEKKE